MDLTRDESTHVAGSANRCILRNLSGASWNSQIMTRSVFRPMLQIFSEAGTPGSVRNSIQETSGTPRAASQDSFSHFQVKHVPEFVKLYLSERPVPFHHVGCSSCLICSARIPRLTKTNVSPFNLGHLADRACRPKHMPSQQARQR
jgi:hypothetical protein